MSDSVLMPQTPPALFSAFATNAAPLVLTDVPAELTRLPAGTVLTADVVAYTDTQNACVLNVALPDGSTVAFQTNAAFPESAGNTVSFKILPNEAAPDTLTVRLIAPKTPDDAPHAQASVSAAANDVVVQNAPVVSGRILQNIPPQLDLSLFEPPAPDSLPKGAQLELRLIAIEPPAARPQAAAQPVLSPNTPASATARPADSALKAVLPQPAPTPETDAPVSAAFALQPSAPTLENPSQIAVLPMTPEATPSEAAGQTTAQTITPPAVPAPSASDIPAPSITPVLKENAPLDTPLPPQQANPAQTTPQAQTAPADSQSFAPVAPSVDFSPVSALPDAPENAASTQPATSGKTASVPSEIKGVFVQPKASEPPMIVSGAGVIALNEKISVPHLSTLTLKIVSLTPPEIPVPDFSPAQENASPWNVLNEAISALEQVNAPAVDALKAVLVQTGNKMPALMLNYLNAVNAGADVRAWLGDANVRALESLGKRGQAVLKQLEKEFSSGAKKMSDGKSVWKGYDIPFMTGTAVEPVSLYLQQSSEALEERAKNKPAPVTAVRFVLDLNLTKLGRVQLEGLSQRAKRSFNLNIRHAYPFDASFEDRVRTLFTKTLDALNYTGVVALKRTDEFIEIKEERAAPAASDGGLWA